MSKTYNFGILLFALILLNSQTVQALQMKEMILDQRLSFKISLYDLNRIEVRGDRINQVFGNGGAFVVDHDTDKGHLYIKPTPANDRRPISLSITTEKGDVQDLILLPFDMPGETVLLKSTHVSDSKGLKDQDQLLGFMKDLVQGRIKSRYTVDHSVEDLPFWENVETKRITTYKNGTLRGEVITFKNIGKTPLHLHEMHFAETHFSELSGQSMTPGKVLAVGLEKSQVAPFETIRVYRILRIKEDISFRMPGDFSGGENTHV